MIIAFSGLDGSGKTTQSRFAEQYLRDRGYRCAYRHAIRGSLHYFILHNLVGRVSGRAKDSMEKGLRETGGAKAFFVSLVKKIFLFLDLVYFNLRYGRYKGQTKRNIICDRYFYDEIVQADYLKIAGNAFNGMYRKLILEPDISFFLKVRPESAFERKKEYNRSYFTQKGKVYETFAQRIKMNEVDEQDPEAAKKAVLSDLERLYTARGTV